MADERDPDWLSAALPMPEPAEPDWLAEVLDPAAEAGPGGTGRRRPDRDRAASSAAGSDPPEDVAPSRDS